MRNSIITIALTVYLCLLVSSAYSRNKKPAVTDSLKGIEITARIYDLKNESDKYKVEILRSNTVDSAFTVNKEEFTFLLKKGLHYGIRISKNDVVIRQINLFTNHPEKSEEIDKFRFHTDLSFDNDPDESGFPIGIVSVKGKLKTFTAPEDHVIIKKSDLALK